MKTPGGDTRGFLLRSRHELQCTTMPKDVGYFQQVLRRELPSLALRYNVSSLGLFGSYIQNKNRPDSDLDVLVTFSKTPSLFRLVELENHSSDLLRSQNRFSDA
jgi:predicted nucleotidyltransferase